VARFFTDLKQGGQTSLKLHWATGTTGLLARFFTDLNLNNNGIAILA
jgi:hypothetical protein